MSLFSSFRTSDWWYPEYFGLDAKLVRNGQEPVSGGGVQILQCQPQGARLLLPLREMCGASIVSAGAVLCPLPPHPCLFSWGIFCWSFFFRRQEMAVFVKGFCMVNAARNPSAWWHLYNLSEAILEGGEGEIPGDPDCPQLPLESAGFRSIYPTGRFSGSV